jgi:O-acetyl-ADP-ribose deacetylase (regulator of RNase III)
MNVRVVSGDIADAQADAICTSTNPRLSLMMGTGGSVRDRGGFEISRACEAILDEEMGRTGRRALRPGSAVATIPGRLACRIVIHCVASNLSHASSPEVVRACTANALAVAAENECRTIAMPVFATGHARVKFDQALTAMLEILFASDAAAEVTIVVLDAERVEGARALVEEFRRA